MAFPAALSDLKSDCTRCAALCCAAFAFETSDMFAIDKPIDAACPNLKPDFSCRIHGERIERGFRGCTLFDCHGAGQRVTQEIFGGKTWRDDPALAAPMFELFRKMLKIHDYLRLVFILEALPLSEEEAAAVAGFREILAPQKGWDRHSLEAFEVMRVVTEFERFAVSLKASPAAKALQARFTGG
jgi:hypothetical protein